MTQERRDRIRATLGDLDALLVTSVANVRWLSGLAASRAAVLLSADGDVLCTDGRYAARAAEVAPDLEVVTDRADGWLAARVPPGWRLGLEEEHLTWGRYERLRRILEGVELVPAGGRVEEARVCKDPDERRLLARACAITVQAVASVLGGLGPGMAEREVARYVEGAFLDHGADDRAFETIVASGPNGAHPHHRPGDRPLAAGDLVTIDAGALVGGYHADMTRTVAVGTPAPRLAEAYEAVRAAQAAGVEAVAAGVTAEAVDAAAREVLVDAGFGDAIRHPTGHGVGLELHERPILRRGEVVTLPAGAVVTVEPGVYLPGLGGVRIEDTVAVDGAGREVLTAGDTRLLTV